MQRVGGYIGYGNKSGQYHASQTYHLASLQNTRGVINVNRASAYGNWLIEPLGDFRNGKIRIKKTRRSLITGGVFNGYSKTLEFEKAPETLLLLLLFAVILCNGIQRYEKEYATQ